LTGRYSRLAPLSGLAFFVLFFVALLVLGGSTPDSDASAAKVVHFYTVHRGTQQAASLVLALASVFLLWFVTILREELRERGSERIATATLAGGIVMSTGFLIMAAAHFGLADTARKLQPAAAQALNAFDGGTFIVSFAGTFFVAVSLTVAVLRLRLLPRVFGYISAVLAVAMLTPIGWIAWMAMSLWIAAAGVVLAVRGTPAATASAGPAEPAAAAA
jgi:hypothetical protein